LTTSLTTWRGSERLIFFLKKKIYVSKCLNEAWENGGFIFGVQSVQRLRCVAKKLTWHCIYRRFFFPFHWKPTSSVEERSFHLCWNPIFCFDSFHSILGHIYDGGGGMGWRSRWSWGWVNPVLNPVRVVICVWKLSFLHWCCYWCDYWRRCIWFLFWRSFCAVSKWFIPHFYVWLPWWVMM